MATSIKLILLIGLAIICKAQEETNSPGLFEKIIRAPFDPLKNVISSGLELKKTAVKMSLDGLNSLAGSVVNTRKAITQGVSNLASTSTNYTTQGASYIGGLLTGMLSKDSLPGSIVHAGGDVFQAAMSSLNAGIQTGIARLTAADITRLHMIHAGITSATTLTESALNKIADANGIIANTTLDIVESRAGTVGAVIDGGLKTVKAGLKMVSETASSITDASKKIAESSMNDLKTKNSAT